MTNKVKDELFWDPKSGAPPALPKKRAATGTVGPASQTQVSSQLMIQASAPSPKTKNEEPTVTTSTEPSCNKQFGSETSPSHPSIRSESSTPSPKTKNEQPTDTTSTEPFCNKQFGSGTSRLDLTNRSERSAPSTKAQEQPTATTTAELSGSEQIGSQESISPHFCAQDSISPHFGSQQPPVTKAQIAAAEREFGDLLRAQQLSVPLRLARGLRPSRAQKERHSELEVPDPGPATRFQYLRRWAPETSPDTPPSPFGPARSVPQSRTDKKTTSR
jgi:hypothetical protein